ncbi:hypothetical protein Lalb_Chr05g0214131 [Lupinus albus]|uniref:Uncharacterized protein n=1 Tax=Lupinus albus TaxID=3870 RepID=A0A6A4QFK4_LUPAL|nr:hypothetical protein Lalb_Chr05g0214131 [Lupinus albus]
MSNLYTPVVSLCLETQPCNLAIKYLATEKEKYQLLLKAKIVICMMTVCICPSTIVFTVYYRVHITTIPQRQPRLSQAS